MLLSASDCFWLLPLLSKVGTDCYMAPEVRHAKKRKEPYGTSSDWYTVGVLAYEFSVGDLPYDHPEDATPEYAPFDFGDEHKRDLITRLLDQVIAIDRH